MSPLRSPKASPAGISNVVRVPSARPSRRCSTAGDSSPAPRDSVAGLSLKVLITSPAGPDRRECSGRDEPVWTVGRAEGEALRSEEHTAELPSPCKLVCRLLLVKKKKR